MSLVGLKHTACLHRVICGPLAESCPHLPVRGALLTVRAQPNDRFQVIENPGSRSKAENVNYALKFVTASLGAVIAIFDADHHPVSTRARALRLANSIPWLHTLHIPQLAQRAQPWTMQDS